jgi:hypothetical protein
MGSDVLGVDTVELSELDSVVESAPTASTSSAPSTSFVFNITLDADTVELSELDSVVEIAPTASTSSTPSTSVVFNITPTFSVVYAAFKTSTASAVSTVSEITVLLFQGPKIRLQLGLDTPTASTSFDSSPPSVFFPAKTLPTSLAASATSTVSVAIAVFRRGDVILELIIAVVRTHERMTR